MMAKAATMIEPSGEARLRAKRRRLWTVIGVLFVAGFFSGFGFAMMEEDGADFLAGAIPGWVALLLSAVWLIAMTVGTMWYRRHVDEVDIAANTWAMAVGGSAVLIGYPVWWLLWRGEIASEPSAHVIFFALYAVGITAYLWKKYR